MPRHHRYRPNIPLMFAVSMFVLAVVAYVGFGVLFTAMFPKRTGASSSLWLALVARCLDATLAAWFFAVGASIGSFLNVLAYRLPLGRTLGGHSACPFCCTPIAASDNIPVFAWLRLRGRCRTCRLPISIQYPLIEFTVGIAFLSVYFSEFAVAGSNLPGSAAPPVGMGLVWMSVTPLLVIRVLLYLFSLSGLIGAALIAMRNVQPPLSLYAFVLLISAVIPISMPMALVVPWSWAGGTVRMSSMLDAIISVGLGGLTGLAAAALTMPFLQKATNHIAWSGTAASLGSLLGWQWVLACISWVLLFTFVASQLGKKVFERSGYRQAVSDPVVWSWLGLLVFRAQWKLAGHFWFSPTAMPLWAIIGLSSLAAIALAWLLGKFAKSVPSHDISSAGLLTESSD